MKQKPKLSKTKKQFSEFYYRCKHGRLCSVHQAAKATGTTFAKLKKWRKSKQGYDDEFIGMSIFRCCINVGSAFTNGKISKEEAEKLLLENMIPLVDWNISIEDIVRWGDLEYFQKRAKERDEHVE